MKSTGIFGFTLFSFITAVLAQTQVISVDGTCSGTHQFTCTGSTFGTCCSGYGYCGSTSDHCGAGCQTGFGTCTGPKNTPDNSCGGTNGYLCYQDTAGCCSGSGYCGNGTGYCGGGCQSSYSVSGSCLTTLVPTNNGLCGPTAGNTTCTGSVSWNGQCCSAYGYCGTTTTHCSNLAGCQSAFGTGCQDP